MPNPEEYRRTRRIVDLLLRIANQPGRWTRRDLARQYEVSEQQMDKDLQLVRHGLRMPLRHRPTGYYFEGLTALPSLTLSLPEALSLLLAARLGQRMPGISRADLAAAIARVEALLPPRLLPLLGGLARNGRDGGSGSATLLDLQVAIAERSRLRLLYRSASRAEPVPGAGVPPGRRDDARDRVAPAVPGTPPSSHHVGAGGPAGPPSPSDDARNHVPAIPAGPPSPDRVGAGGPAGPHPAGSTERVVDPYTLLPYLKSWYLVGHCHLRGEVRIFKVDRILAMSRTGERFDYPEGFDLAAYLGPAWGIVRGGAGEPEEVVLEFDAEAGRWIRDQQLHESQRVEELPDGRVRIGLVVGVTPDFRGWVLGFGRRVRVVRPASLAAWVRDEARAVVETGERRDLEGGEQPAHVGLGATEGPFIGLGERLSGGGCVDGERRDAGRQ